MLKYLNFNESIFDCVIIYKSDLSESVFDNCNMKKFFIDQNKLYKTEFINTKLIDVDFTTCDTYGVIFDMKSVKGIIVNSLECRDIALMLDIKIRD